MPLSTLSVSHTPKDKKKAEAEAEEEEGQVAGRALLHQHTSAELIKAPDRGLFVCFVSFLPIRSFLSHFFPAFQAVIGGSIDNLYSLHDSKASI